MKTKRILLIAIPSIAIIGILMVAWWPKPSYIPGPRELLPETSITLSRLTNCRIFVCDELINSTSVISKYPQLESSLRELDRSKFFNQTVSFLMPTESALQLSDNLEHAGAKRHGQCIEGGCHSLSFRLENSTDIYDIALVYGGGFPP